MEAPPSYLGPVQSGSNATAKKPRQSGHSNELVVASNFIRAVRESGYVSLSNALAELIDNSLQAAASKVMISINRAEAGALPEIRVWDDGHGMTRDELEACLRFGGTSRFGDRDSFGRFGMGLPAASLSQSRRVEVTAWTADSGTLEVALDVDQVAEGEPATLRARRGHLQPT